MDNQALILAGGFGTRLGDLTKEIPKPVLPVAGQPFLAHLIYNLSRHGINRLVISTGYLADKVEEALGDGSRYGVSIQYMKEQEPLGTGGAVRFCREWLDDGFFVVNGDTLVEANYWALRQAAGDSAGMVLRHVPDTARYGRVEWDGTRILEFKEKGLGGEGLINAGIYWLRQHHLDRLPPGKCSLESELFPLLTAENELFGVVSGDFFIDIGLPETLAASETEVPAWRHKPCAFLDRDGVINVNTHHTHRPEDFQWIEGAPEAIRMLNELGYLVIVVTNQAGIAKGKYTEEQFHTFMEWIAQELHQRGGHWDAYYYCPYHPTEGLGDYLRDSEDRKPKPGMLLRAKGEWEMDWTRSFMIGDKESDMEAASAAGIAGHLFEGGSLLEFVRELLTKKA